MISSYKTVSTSANDEYVVQKSRFIGYASPCESESEARAFIDAIKLKNRDATHNCWAYIIGYNSNTMRYSDDGEPSGTAGMPILETIKSMGLVNCVVVVTRYFGGILLGAGELIRAYRKGASIALKASKPIIMQSTYRLHITMDYALWARFENKLCSMPIISENIEYSDKVVCNILVLAQDIEHIKNTIMDFCDGRVDIVNSTNFYHPWPIVENINE